MPSGSDRQLAIGYWIVSHKQTLKTWWAISLLSFIALSLLWFIVFFVIFFTQQPKLDRMISQMASATAGFSTQAFQPQALTTGAVSVITRDTQHVDLVAEVTNPNSAWAATDVTTHFVVNGQSLPTQHTFLNEQSHRPVIQTNAAVDPAKASAVTLVLDTPAWTRSASASLPAPVFTVDQQQLTPTTVTVGGRSVTTLALKATVMNRSVYNYFRVTVPIVVLAGEQPVAAEQLTLDRWPTLTTKTITVTWPYPVSGGTSVRIEPQVNRYDLNNIYR